MITITLEGADALCARLAAFSERAQQSLATAMTGLGADLLDRVEDNLGGAVLQRRSGRLAAAQRVSVTLDGDAAAVAVGFDPDEVPYGAIQEFGGTTRAHLIAAKQAFALAFSLRGALVFAKRVNHPGSVIPERSFLRSALDAMAPDASDAAQAAIVGELRA